MTIDALLDPAWGAVAQQRCFRALLQAMSYPGSVQRLDEQLGREPALVLVCATLIDQASRLADPDEILGDDRHRLLGAPTVPPSAADYIVVDGAQAPTVEPRLGDVFEPEAGATLLIRVAGLGQGPTVLELSGPGIESVQELRFDGLHPAWLERRQAWCAAYPLGVDCLFCSPTAVVGLPRTTRVQEPVKEKES